MSKPTFVVLDIETTGLDVERNMILELGILLLDDRLDDIAAFHVRVSDDNAVAYLDYLAQLAVEEPQHRGVEPWRGGALVHEMHQKSGLAEDIRADYVAGRRFTMAEAEDAAVKFLDRFGIDATSTTGLRRPMVGSSIQFDRKFLERHMPVLESKFHYRNIDVSTLKGITDVMRADVVKIRQDTLHPASTHRALPDCYDTRGELAFYLNTFFSKEATSHV